MVFQSTLPVAIRLAFTAWTLDAYAVLAAYIALAGDLLAIVTLQIRRRFSARAIVLWALLYTIFVAMSSRRRKGEAQHIAAPLDRSQRRQ